MENLTILIVEDVDINRAILANIFEQEYEVLQAENGKVALEILKSGKRVDLILLDLIMPIMGGIEFMEHVKSDNRFDKIPIIINTQKGENETAAHAFELGADDFVTKPYNPKTLKRRVKNLTEKYVLERRQMESLLRNTSDILQTLTDAVPGGIGTFEIRESDKLFCNYYNDSLCELLGYTREEFGKLLKEFGTFFIDIEDRPKLLEALHKSIRDKSKLQLVVRMRKKNEDVIWVGVTAQQLKEKTKYPIFHAVFMDLTEEKKNELEVHKTVEELRYRIAHDVLTGVYNRETFYEKTRTFLNKHKDERCIISVWNIDRFKVVNELFGSEIGNEVLKNFAAFIASNLTDVGTYGRLEADHFATCTTLSIFEKNKQDIDMALDKGILEDVIDYPVRVHIGLYIIDEPSLPIDVMCDRASLALQAIKSNVMERSGFYSSEMSVSLFNEQDFVNEMNKALEQRQFYIQLQPITDAVTGQVVSAEALVRWNHPVKGVISPGVFIPVFERNGFIIKLDVYVWKEVCKVLAENKVLGIPNVPISINVSRINFYRKDLLEELLDLLKNYGLTTDLLKLEITESAYTDNPEQLLSVMQLFQEKGFKILMDDFGSGYSSLNMLKNVPADILKIDMNFMDNLESSQRASDIIRSIIDMAKRLNMQTVAEGVETKNQFKLLRNMGCDTIQGYYFSKPLMVEDFREYIKNNSSEKFLQKEKESDIPWILVVDDIEMIRVSLRYTLEPTYKVIEAEDGKEAYEILENYGERIDLLLTDIMMPRMDGFELLASVKENTRLNHIPTIIITANGEADNAIKALSMGAIDVITKPFEADILMARVRNIISINKNKDLEKKIYSLREVNYDKHNFRNIVEDGTYGLCRIKLLDNLKKYEILFANDQYYIYHGIQKNDRKAVYNIETLIHPINNFDVHSIEEYLRYSIKKRKEILQNIIYCITSKGQLKKVFSTASIIYSDNEVYIEILEVEIFTDEEYMKQPLTDQLSANKSLLDVSSATDNASAIFSKEEKWRDEKYKKILKRGAYLFAEVDLSENKLLKINCKDMKQTKNKEIIFYDQLVNNFIQRKVHPDERSYVKGMLMRHQLLKWFKDGEQEYKFDLQLKTADNCDYEWYSSTTFFMQKDKHSHVYIIWQIKNVNDEKTRLNHIIKLAEHDPLTGLYNRAAFKKKMKESYEKYKNFGYLSAFFMVDIDNFKQINDSFGHEFGDKIIKTIATQIRTTFRKEDSVGRLGGDEFAIFISHINKKSIAEKKARELCNKIQITFDNCGKDIYISCSIGIAFAPEAGTDFKTLYIHADEAQYRAKKSGKNRYVIY